MSTYSKDIGIKKGNNRIWLFVLAYLYVTAGLTQKILVFRNESLTVITRVKDLLTRLTVKEKIGRHPANRSNRTLKRSL